MFLQPIKAAMVALRAACSDQSQGEPGAKRAKKARVTETSTTVEATTACSVPEKEKIQCLLFCDVSVDVFCGEI